MKRTVCIFFGAALLWACSSSVKVSKPEGETASLSFGQSLRYDAELLAVNENWLFFTYEQKIYQAPLSTASSIYVQGYSVTPGKVAAAAPHVMLSALIATSATGSAGGVFFAVLLPLQVWAALSGGPRTKFGPKPNESDLSKLRLYCRYPQGLTQDQWKVLLKHYGQEQFLPVP